ncbi:hypothetical protein Tco_1099331, partial [Tanacetum coccineum]
KSNYSSWASRMLLYIKGKEDGKLLVDSVLNGPFQYGSMVEPRNETTLAMIRARTYTDLTDEEKIRESVYIKATNIVLQGLVVPSFNPSNAPITNLNKLMAFVSTSFGPRFLQTNNQLRTLSNPKNQATIQDGRTNNLEAFDFDCDDVPSAKAVLMANLSSYDSDVLSEVTFHGTNIENAISYQSVQETRCSEQPSFVNDTEVDITNDSNIISYKQYLQETEPLVVQSISSSVQQYTLLMSVIEEMSRQVVKCNKVQQEYIVDNETLAAELERYKEQVKLLEQRQKFDLIDIEKYIEGQLRQVPALYDGNTIVKTHFALSITDSKETLELAEESRLKMLAKQNDPSLKEKKVKIAPIDYVALNKLSKHFAKHFVPKKQLSAEQAYCLPISQPVVTKPLVPSKPALKKEIPCKLPTINKKYFEIEKKELSLDNDHLLEHIICQDIMNIVMHAHDQYDNLIPVNNSSLVHYNPALDLLKHENDRLIEMLISQDLVYTNDYKSMEQRLEMLGVSCSTEASRSKPRSNTKKDRIMQTSSNNKNKNKVEDQPRIAKSGLNNVNRISKTVCNKNVKHYVLNANSELVFTTCHECMFDSIHDSYVRVYLNDVSASVKSKSVKAKTTKSKTKKVWKTTGKVFTNVGYRWIPIGQTFTLDGNTCPLTRFTSTKIVPPKKPTPTQVLRFLTTWNPCKTEDPMFLLLHLLPVSISGRTNRTLIAKIMGYGDYQLGNVTISRVYYVVGLGHILFSVGQFCDSDLEVAFQKHACFIRNLDGVDLISGSRDINLYTISLDDMLKSSLICLLSKDSKTKSWLWHR